MYDVIVIGARCAGAPTAMLLARKGHKVLLVDRATFPSDIPHGHFIHRQGPRRLARWGILDRVVSTNCPPITSMVMDLGDFPLVGRSLSRDGIAFGYGPRRSALDNVLVDAAIEAGVELREGFAVERIEAENGRVTGIHGRGRSERASVTERARVTVGADGRHSRLAGFVKAPVYDASPAVACWYFSYWSGVDLQGLEHYYLGDRAVFAHPTNDGLTAVFVGWPIEAFPRVRTGIEAHFMAALDAVPSLGDRVRNGRREERFSGVADVPNFFRKPYGPGWALVGDAGCHKDPYLALGINDAFRDAEFLVEALDDGLTGRCDLEASLEHYERRRNEASAHEYWQNLSAARFIRPPEDIYRIRAAIRGDQEATTLFMLAREGVIPHETFFNPDNLGRLLAPMSQGSPV